MPLNEQSLRRADFTPGTPIQLADGQVWQFRRPRVRFRPSHHASGFAVVLTGARDGFAELLERHAALLEGDETTVGELAAVELDLGARMLLANYDLTPEQLGDVLQFGYDRDEDPEAWGIRQAVVDVALGNGPKPSTGGDESPPTPPAD